VMYTRDWRSKHILMYYMHRWREQMLGEIAVTTHQSCIEAVEVPGS
jgi:hypothetical protein